MTPQDEDESVTRAPSSEVATREGSGQREAAISAAEEILGDLIYELSHQVHVPGCKCELAIRKLQHARDYLRPIHWVGMPVGECLRKDSGMDLTTEISGQATIIYGNITCPMCRKAALQELLDALKLQPSAPGTLPAQPDEHKKREGGTA